MPVPEQHECDPSNPREAFVWALVGLPGPKQNVPLLVHPNVLEQWSEHLWQLGLRHHPEHQTREWHPPSRGQNHWINGAGRWVEAGTPRPPTVTAPDMAILSHHERAAVVAQLHQAGNLNHLLEAARQAGAADALRQASVGTAAPADEPVNASESGWEPGR
ncbi:phage gene 29 protein family protein [Nocardia terpenica]|uniref:DUF2744 domain-containing protein n=1 Tax=Nocardia terpenica TaxID=455432 RepID=A0A164H1E2_9NOCA|nr:DUF2744 domain-containing protein [Nocardia terpenica]KZM68121.1 hypothetical protein AWN90_09270 [Nocardia terpenica]NQE89022.1 DUF2744 domain-containing protein [Nocardia terpenica]